MRADRARAPRRAAGGLFLRILLVVGLALGAGAAQGAASFWTVPRVFLAGGLALAVALAGMALWRYRSVRELNRALARREQRFRALAEGLGEAVLVVGAGGEIEYANPAARRMLGRGEGELEGTKARDLLAPGERLADSFRAFLEERPRAPSLTRELRLRRADGTEFEARVTLSPYVRKGEVEGSVASFSDVIHRRAAERRARFHARLLDVVGEAVIATKPDGTVILWNRRAAELYGWTALEAVGRDVNELVTPPEGQQDASGVMEAVRKGESWSGEFTVRRRDGSTFPAQVTNTPVYDEDGELTAIVGASFDLSERRSLEKQLRQAQKMEAVGRLAGGVAHDFNNLMTAIRGHADLLVHEVGTEAGRTGLNEIRRAARRASELTRQLLAFGRKQVLQPSVLDPSSVVAGMEPMLARLAGEHVRLEVALPAERWSVEADRGQLEQVVLNLVLNAREAVGSGGEVRVSVENVRVDEPGTRPGLPPGEYAVLAVRDTGPGIPDDVLPSVFDPFFTTKPTGQGAGLGLSTVYGIVKQSGGWVYADSPPGEGAVFRVYLPRTRTAAPAPTAAPGPDRGASGDEVVLVVEDEASVRTLVERVLVRRGYRVVSAEDGPRALERLAELERPVDLVVTDVVMPGMSGPELAARIRADRPGIPVLYMSGYPADALDVHGGVPPGRFLQKPFSPSELAERVRRVLDARGRAEEA